MKLSISHSVVATLMTIMNNMTAITLLVEDIDKVIKQLRDAAQELEDIKFKSGEV